MADMTVPGQRKASPACKFYIQSFEKCRLAAYLPTPNDVPTIGWGATGKDVRLGLCWTQAQADARFDRDMAMFAAGVDHEIGTAATTQGQFDALVSFAYNDGVHALEESTLLRLHRDGKFAAAEAEFGRWVHQHGKVLNGLVRRRKTEAAMYRGWA